MAEFQGLTAITSDHGNALGERAFPFPIRVYGHPLGVLIPALIDVPWLSYQNGDRRRTTSEPPVTDSDSDPSTDVPRDRLRNLGYVE